MFLLVLLHMAHVLLTFLLQLMLSAKLLMLLQMLPSTNAASHSSDNVVYCFCLGASNKINFNSIWNKVDCWCSETRLTVGVLKQGWLLVFWNKVDCWCSETRLTVGVLKQDWNTQKIEKNWILIRQKCAHVFFFWYCSLLLLLLLFLSELWILIRQYKTWAHFQGKALFQPARGQMDCISFCSLSVCVLFVSLLLGVYPQNLHMFCIVQLKYTCSVLSD